MAGISPIQANGMLEALLKRRKEGVSPLASATPVREERRVTMPSEVKEALKNSFNTAISSGPWRVGQVAQPLSEEDLRFLRSHTVANLEGVSEPNPVLSLIVGAIQIALTTPPSVERAAGGGGGGRSLAGEIVEAPTEGTVTKAGTDPAITYMEETTLSGAKGLVTKAALREANGFLSTLSEETQKGVQELVDTASKVARAAAVSGKWLSKVKEVGVNAATFEVAGDIVADFVVHKGAKALADLASCGVAGCAGAIGTVIRETFAPIETAPDWHDTFGALPPPSFETVTKPREIRLDPAAPAIGSPK